LPNQYLVERLQGIQAALMAHHAGGTPMPNASKGSERETFLREFLSKVFPETFRFGTGAITDSAGKRSGQLDIVIEYPILPSFPMPGGADRLYLAESVAAVLSVKSNISSQWREVEAEAEKLEPLKRRWLGATQSRGSGITFGGPLETAVPFIAVGYTGYKSVEALQQRLKDTPELKRPLAALSIDSGVFVGSGIAASGVWGLYALAVSVATELHGLLGVSADATSYARP
jgi:hypothetical protein